MLNIRSLPAERLNTLIENRTTFTLEQAEMNLFETHQFASAVHLRFDHPVLASMIQGRKVMHLRGHTGFNFLPGESVLLPGEEEMVIDFPDANQKNPTKCLALEIAPEEIRKVTAQMDEHRPRCDQSNWTRADNNFHFLNDHAVNQLIQRLVFLCAEDHPAKDLFFSMSLRELLIRLLEAESRDVHLRDPNGQVTSQPITASVAYILSHLDDKLSVATLSRMAYMSESGYYRAFKNEMGLSPVDFINKERIKLAASLLRKGTQSIQEVALRCGFNSASYFTRRFKKAIGICPLKYQAKAG
ncbi:MAG: AraC family transcriptional regulator [Bacteroidota bacterium]